MMFNWNGVRKLAVAVFLQWEKEGRPDDFRFDVKAMWQMIVDEPIPEYQVLRQVETPDGVKNSLLKGYGV